MTGFSGSVSGDGGTAVVLGGTGFLGRNLCVALSEAGYRVVAVARRAVEPPPGCVARQVDVAGTEPGELAAVLSGDRPDIIVNAAGAVWGATEQDWTETNVRLVERLVAAATALPRPPRLIHLGSVYEYGPQPPGTVITENTPAAPVAAYARGKLHASRLVCAAADRISTLVLRLTTVIGPGAPQQSLFGSVARQLAKGTGGDPVVLTLPALDGERDLVDVRDAAEAVLRAARAPVTGVLNVGRGELSPVRAAVDRLIAISGRRVSVLTQPQPAERRDAGFGAHRISISAARSSLGWAPRYAVDDALESLWRNTSGLLVG
jgi:NDP-hexose 4-ketoreductase